MPAVVHKIDFSAPADRSNDSGLLNLVHRKVIPFVPEIALLSMRHPVGTLPCYRRNEALTAVLLVLGLHLAGFVLLPAAEQEESLTAPAPIQVAWITTPQPKKENTPPAPPRQQQPVSKSKPKPKAVKRGKARQKAVLSTAAPATTSTTVPMENPTKTAAPPVTKTPEALPAKPAANTAQPLSSAPHAQAADQQPLVLPNLNAGYLDNPAPRYPEEARERGEQGKVLVRALINVDGTVAELAMKRSSGFSDLDRSALETVKKWRFVPARRGATAVSAWVVVPISFSLEG
ncbi:MAG: TonB family protein [Methylomicrobium sp.]